MTGAAFGLCFPAVGKAATVASDRSVTGQPPFLDVEQALQDVAALVRSLLAKKRLTLGVRVHPATPRLLLEAPTLKRILYNLVEHAIHFAPEGGQVVVEAGSNPPAASGDDAILLIVSENGAAVAGDAERRARGYDQLEAGPPPEPGAQPGRLLRSTRQLVEGFGGRLWVESTPGNGSTLNLVLPTGASSSS